MSKGNFIFDSVKTPNPPRNKFDVPWESFGSYKIGPCYPLFAIPMFPGDRFRGSSDMLIRALPMIAPTMGPLKAYVHYFFIPNRLVWQDWEKFITGGEDGTYVGISRCVAIKSICEGLVSWVEAKPAFLPGGLIDHLYGWCFDSEEDISNCADQTPLDTLPIAMYALLFKEYYCDQNVDDVTYLDRDLQSYFKATTEEEVLDSTFSIIELLNRVGNPSDLDITGPGLFYRRYLKDYFTSALPFTQRGPDVTLPITASGSLNSGAVSFKPGAGVSVAHGAEAAWLGNDEPGGETYLSQKRSSGTEPPVISYDEITAELKDLSLDLSNLTSATINDLRRAIALQRFYEISARGGSRYIEQILAHFHVRSSDARLQRPEYLGGGVTQISVGEVFQTSSTDETSPQGNLAGRGVGYGRSNKFRFFAEEHGYLIGILSLVPDAVYYQGIDKIYTKTDRLEYPWPEFGNLGEQEIKKSELFVPVDGTDNSDKLFGYTARYSEYKHGRTKLHGDVRGSLRFWTWSRELTAANLNSEFLRIPNIANPFAVKDTDPFIIWVVTYLDALRNLPYYGTPSGLGI